MSILSENADLNIDLLWSEVFGVKNFSGASDCNENIAKKKFYANIDQNNDRPLATLQGRFWGGLANRFAMDFYKVEEWIDQLMKLVQVRPDRKMRIGISKRIYDSSVSTYWDPYTGPEIRLKIERQGMRKRKHWYNILAMSIRAINEGDDLARIIVERIECSNDSFTYFYTDENGNFIRES